MKIVFVSNYFNHHQFPFCEELYRRFGAEFTFVSTTIMREERRKLGYVQNDLPSYVFLSYESEQQKKSAALLIEDADVVIAGSAPNVMLAKRIRSGKLIFRYCERPFKKKIFCLQRAYHAFGFRQKNFFKKNIYMLCASAYAASDYASIGMYRNRMYRWGYFPAVKEYDVDELMFAKKSNMLMWCGRFVDWKHPDDAIQLAHKLKENGYEFRLNMVGTGAMEEEVKQMVKKYHLEDSVCFLGSMSPEQVRTYMEEAGIYLFTSNRQEGWGAVLNESMNSGCAVVASHAIGSVPFMLEDGKNGCIYTSGNVDMLFEKVKYLLDYPTEARVIGRHAYETVVNEWNAKIAAERFVRLAESVLAGQKSLDIYESGPVSKAEVLKDK